MRKTLKHSDVSIYNQKYLLHFARLRPLLTPLTITLAWLNTFFLNIFNIWYWFYLKLSGINRLDMPDAIIMH